MAVPALALMAGGTLMNVYGQYQQGKAAEKAAEYNARIQEITGRQKESLIRRQGRKELSRIRTAVSKSGVRMEGSPMEVLAESAANIEMDALNARFGMETGATATRAEGKSRKRGANLSAAAQLLSGAGSTYAAGHQLGVFT